MDRDPKSLSRNSWAKRFFFTTWVLIVLFFLPLVYLARIKFFEGNTGINLILGLIITSAGFFIPSRANTFDLGYRKLGVFQFPKIKVAGYAAFILTIGGFINTFVILLFKIEDEYINLLAQAVFVSSTIIAIGGHTVDSKIVNNKIHYRVTAMGQIAIIVLMAGLSVKVVDEYFVSLSKKKTEIKQTRTIALAEEANEKIKETIASMDSLDNHVLKSIETLKDSLPTSILDGQMNIIELFPTSFKDNFKVLSSNFNTKYFSRFNKMKEDLSQIDSNLNITIKGKIDSFNTSALDELKKELTKSEEGFNNSKVAYNRMIEVFNKNLSSRIFSHDKRIYYGQFYVDSLQRKLDSLTIEMSKNDAISQSIIKTAEGSCDTLVIVVKRN